MIQQMQWTPELVAKFWDGVSLTRLSEISFFRTGGRTLFSIIGRHFRPGDTVLDIGAGDGDLAQWAIERGCRVAVMEPSASRRATMLGRDFTRSANFLGFVEPGDGQTFDVVIATEVLEHVLDTELSDFLLSLRRSTKVGGKLIVTTPNEEDLELNMAFCPTSGTLFHRWQHQRSLSVETLSTMLAGAGFRAESVRTVDYSHYRFGNAVGTLFGIIKKLRGGSLQGLVYVGTSAT